MKYIYGVNIRVMLKFQIYARTNGSGLRRRKKSVPDVEIAFSKIVDLDKAMIITNTLDEEHDTAMKNQTTIKVVTT